jgi:hypothetical protein
VRAIGYMLEIPGAVAPSAAAEPAGA